jgi:hypothetical protein
MFKGQGPNFRKEMLIASFQVLIMTVKNLYRRLIFFHKRRPCD